MQVAEFQVRKDQLTGTQTRIHILPALLDGRVRVAIARFALTSNHITYAAFGDAMNYWRFLPALQADGTPDLAGGCIPVWGFGLVVESRSQKWRLASAGLQQLSRRHPCERVWRWMRRAWPQACFVFCPHAD